MAPPIPLTWHEALSGITGSISLASWIIIFIPQLLENYYQGSAEGISLTFLFIWMIGDVANLAGALWAGLVPTVIAIAVYFCCSDLVLISQCLYYYRVNRKSAGTKDHDNEGAAAEGNGHAITPTEETPLLDGSAVPPPRRKLTDVTGENLGLPGSRRKSSTDALSRRRTASLSNPNSHTLERILEEPTKTSTALKNTLAVLLVFLVGTAGWAVAYKTGAWKPTPIHQHRDTDDAEPIGAAVLGYFSAVCYLGARIPQIIKNQRERSCEGLSLLFFMLSLVGNLTYGAGVGRF